MMKVKMIPHLSQIGNLGGISRVVEAYFKYLPDYDVELVSPQATSYDLLAAHAGILGVDCDVAHLHGIYFTADYQASHEEYVTNRNVIRSALTAKIVTVPTSWVAKTFQRDMRINPEVLPHGIEAQEWEHDGSHEGYVLWNKTRHGDVCDPAPIGRLAQLAPDVLFASTIAPQYESINLKITGVTDHPTMKQLVQKAAVYLSTTKETFGIGVLEALAAGTPVLGWAFGGNLDLVEHGSTGYLAQVNNYEDLLNGLEYCLQYRAQLSENARIAAKSWTWPNVMQRLVEIYKCAIEPEEPTAAIVIPVYNKPIELVERAVRSALAQDYPRLERVVIIDDCSDNGEQIAALDNLDNKRLLYLRTQFNSGVANARNYGIAQTASKYIACLDGDDAIEPTFLSRCITHIESNPAVGLAYTRLREVSPGGSTVSAWPPSAVDYQRQIEHFNQIPTCCVFRRKVWEKLGGYRQRYAPYGAGEEDTEFWLRIGSIGYRMEMATEEPLFLYTNNGQNSVYTNPNHTPTDWTAWHPWAKDGRHPFASIAKPANEQSHPVRQYDQPLVSVIVPVAPWHLPYLVDALDSLEAQTYRLWEVVCVFDGLPADPKQYARLRKAYPYITAVENFSSPKGTGWARDAGVKASKGSFLVFLDADDYLAPGFLDKTLKLWNEKHGIIYTDYVDRAIWGQEDYNALPDERKVFYNTKTHEAFIRRFSKDYDWNEAIRQPEYNPNDANAPFYVWCINTVLMPRAWYDAIGGFDQTMETWEDVDLHWRLARTGRPYFKVAEPLVTYRFTSGSRREAGQVRDQATADNFKRRIESLKEKYKGVPIMPCTGCGGSGPSPLASQMNFRDAVNTASVKAGFGTMSDGEFVECVYTHLNMGMHPVVGAATGKSYGYHGGGGVETFYVHTSDIAARPDVFRAIVKEQAVVVPESPEAIPNVPPPPDRKPDFQNVSGITHETEGKLVAAGIYNVGDILRVGKQGLENAGVPPRVAGLILNSAKRVNA